MPAPTIYYIRHGETSWNAEGRLQGAQDTSLNELGRQQAAHAGGILAGLFAQEGPNASSLAFVASPLGRARSTMELVRGALKLPPHDYTIDDRLREIGYGEWEGSTLAQMQARDPKVFARRQVEKWTVAPPGGETYAAVQSRMRDGYDQLVVDTVAVAHETAASAADLTIEQGAVYVFRDGRLRKYS